MDSLILGVLMTLSVVLSMVSVATFFENENVWVAFVLAVMATISWSFLFTALGVTL